MANHTHAVHRACMESIEPRVLLSTYAYLSNLVPTVMHNGYGPVELDQSNGEAVASDGNPLTINGLHYGKGLGVHADAELHYKLNGKYRNFISDVGVDDEVGTEGSVVFQVYADGEKLFDSGVMTGTSDRKRVNVDVTQKRELVLIVNDAADGETGDHANWAGARLVEPEGIAPVITNLLDVTLEEPRTFLSVDGSFVDAGAGPWIASVDWGDGSGRRRLALNSEAKTFELEHTYDATHDGDYTVTVRVHNAGATAVQSFRVRVENIAPSRVGLLVGDPSGNLSALTGLQFRAGGVFFDPGEFGGQTYTAMIDYGDGTAPQRSPVGGRFFDAIHTYESPGTYTITSTVTDSAGESGVGVNTVVVTEPDWTDLSDLRPVTAHAGPGLYNADLSFSQNPLRINGVRYEKGIGVAANSEIEYALGGDYQAMISDVGVDDEVGRGGYIQFQVFADDRKIYDSGAMRGTDDRKQFKLDLTGVSALRLVVVRPKGGTPTSNDHGDWGGIRIV